MSTNVKKIESFQNSVMGEIISKYLCSKTIFLCEDTYFVILQDIMSTFMKLLLSKDT